MGKNNTKTYSILSNMPISKLRELQKSKDNLQYLFKKSCIVRENGSNKLFIGDINNKVTIKNNIKGIKQLETLKCTYNNEIVKEYESLIKSFCTSLSVQFKSICGKVAYRLTIGLGNPNVTETDITLHHIYGIPYIPGQALKGSTRNYFLEKYFDIEKLKFDYIEINNVKVDGKVLYEYIFGDDLFENDNKVGNVIFFDSFPVGNFTIEKDVMNVHYKEYYNDNGYPLDSSNPNLISFYSMKDTKFKFIFAIKKNSFKIKYGDENTKIEIEQKYLIKFIDDLIKGMVVNHGIGAKTSVGYGYFEIDENLQENNKKKFKPEKR